MGTNIYVLGVRYPSSHILILGTLRVHNFAMTWWFVASIGIKYVLLSQKEGGLTDKNVKQEESTKGFPSVGCLKSQEKNNPNMTQKAQNSDAKKTPQKFTKPGLGTHWTWLLPILSSTLSSEPQVYTSSAARPGKPNNTRPADPAIEAQSALESKDVAKKSSWNTSPKQPSASRSYGGSHNHAWFFFSDSLAPKQVFAIGLNHLHGTRTK